MGDCEEGIFFLSIVLACLVSSGSFAPIVFAQSGPKTPTMQIHIYLHPDIENAALETGTIDMNDWPLMKDWIDKWALMPSDISLREYVENSIIQIDMNNQMWPTGSSTSKFYDPADNQSVKSAEFRKAIAHLIDREAIIRDVLKGYGFRADLPLTPLQSAYADMYNYTVSDLIYNYNKTKAQEILDAAGFTLNAATKIRRDPIKGGDLQPIIFYIRQDDSNRRRAGELLCSELLSIGILVNAPNPEHLNPWPWIWPPTYWNLYTGGWNLGPIPDNYYDLYSSSMYNPVRPWWSPNLVGFCNHEFDEWASKVKYPTTLDEAREAAIQCGRIFLKYCPVVPVWSPKAVKAYRTGWTGIVNNAGYGIDNPYTFLNMNKTGDIVINWGFKSDIEQLNVIGTAWTWDRKVLGLIYESLLGDNPFTLSVTEFLIAGGYSIGSWNSKYDTEATVVTFKIRDDVRWHGDNASLTIEDVAFSFDYTYECAVEGEAYVAWNYPLIISMNRTNIVNSTAIEIYYNYRSAWAVYWAGQLPIIRKSIWENVTPGIPAKIYDPMNTDANGNNITDLLEDGTGPWTFAAYSLGNYVTLKAYDQYYLTQSFIEEQLRTTFHYDSGDVNEDGIVNILDSFAMAKALGTDAYSQPHGNDWNQYNPACDLNRDGKVDLPDLVRVSCNYGRTQG